MNEPISETDPAGDSQYLTDELRAEFDAAARRSLPVRFRYSFIRTYKPVLDDATYRSFNSTAEYRRWCEENLPSWLGYGRDPPTNEQRDGRDEQAEI